MTEPDHPSFRQSPIEDLQHFKIRAARAERIAEDRQDRIEELEAEIVCNNDLIRKMEAEREAQAARIAELEAALEWYGENARLCRLIHSEGDLGRNALSEDGGKRSRAALKGTKP